MAPSEGVVNEKLYYNCHGKKDAKEAKGVDCIICGSVYHISCFNTYRNVQHIKGALVLCNKHSVDELTSNFDFNKLDELETIEEAKEIIMQLGAKLNHIIEQNIILEELKETLKENNKML